MLIEKGRDKVQKAVIMKANRKAEELTIHDFENISLL